MRFVIPESESKSIESSESRTRGGGVIAKLRFSYARLCLAFSIRPTAICGDGAGMGRTRQDQCATREEEPVCSLAAVPGEAACRLASKIKTPPGALLELSSAVHLAVVFKSQLHRV